MSPLAVACEANLELSSVPGFVERGVLGSEGTYSQKVYSGEQMSYSTLVFSPGTAFNKNGLMRQTAKSMISTVSAVSNVSDPQVQVLNKEVLPNLDDRLAFLSYVTHRSQGLVNIEASASIRIGSCWSVLRFSALKKQTRDESLNHFANLIRATLLIQ
ncbi:hypothetical protein OBB02_03305 [Candidatus Puniceispirillum sp.]|nr:hypothetical protein [Candidatus Puniceispirillum sp.]